MITMAVIVVEIMVTEAMTTPDHPVDMAMVNTIVILISKPPLLIHHTVNKTIIIPIITKLKHEKKIIFKKKNKIYDFQYFL